MPRNICRKAIAKTNSVKSSKSKENARTLPEHRNVKGKAKLFKKSEDDPYPKSLGRQAAKLFNGYCYYDGCRGSDATSISNAQAGNTNDVAVC